MKTVTLCPLDIEETSLPGFPHTLENLENQENDKINFQAWKRKKIRNSWNNPGNFLTDVKLELSIFLEEISDPEAFCSLLITNYGHGTGLTGQGTFNFIQVREKLDNLFFGQGILKNSAHIILAFNLI